MVRKVSRRAKELGYARVELVEPAVELRPTEEALPREVPWEALKERAALYVYCHSLKLLVLRIHQLARSTA